jgi:SAM-dependent methyltransferase
VTVWSAGCSTGQEPYSIAMAMVEAFGTMTPPVRIVASDIDTDALAVRFARHVSPREARGPRSRAPQGASSSAARARTKATPACSPQLRALVDFKRVNLSEGAWPVPETIAAIFCRNVMIYFSRDTQAALVRRFAQRLAPDGLLFAGTLGEPALRRGRPLPRVRPHRVSRHPGRRVMAATWSRRDAMQPTRYHDKAFACEAVKILPGEYFATDRDMALVTVLGSCVAACLRDPVAGIGGMNHFMLPERRHVGRRVALGPLRRLCDGSPHQPAHAHGREARPARGEGLRRRRGGARAHLGQHRRGERRLRDGLPARRAHLGERRGPDGSDPRKVYFFPRTGKVLVRMLRTLRNATILERENELLPAS